MNFRIVLPVSAAAFAAFTAPAALKTSWDVGDYVQSGLIMHYDAIRNVGAAAVHDPSATQWKDLASEDGYAENRACVYGGNGSWADDAYMFTGVSCMETRNAPAFGGEFTVQIACDFDVTSDSRTHPTVFACDDFGFSLNRSYDSARAATNLFWGTKTYSGNNTPTQTRTWGGRYINAAFDSSFSYITEDLDWDYCKTVWGMRVARTSPVDVPALSYTMGARPMGGDSGGRNYCSIGGLHSVRVYSRKLENSELAWNRAIDEIRFHGGSATPYTNVVVAASFNAGLAGVEAPGPYVVDGAHVFSALPVSCDGGVWNPVGYTIETWDAAAGAWGAASRFTGSEYRHEASGASVPVRLAWIWELQSGVRRMDAADYVQDGIIAHFDGIRNAGAFVAHDSAASRWTDISPLGGFAKPDLSVYAGNLGSWADDAYVFAGQSYMRTGSIALGGEFTIQIACNMDAAVREAVTNSPTLLSAANNFAIYLDREWARAATNIYWNVDKFGGTARPTILDWTDPRYVTGAFTSSNMYITDRGEWRTGWGVERTRTILDDVPAMTFVIGGMTSRNGMTGKFYSLRMYSRHLSNAELSLNRAVDEVRFHGAQEASVPGAVCVCSSRPALSGAERGVYMLAGSYTFTAAPALVGDTRYLPVGSTVETWDAAAGRWADPVFTAGPSRSLAADGSSARRLTWKWRADNGLILIFQ